MTQLRTLVIVLCCQQEGVQTFTDGLLEAVSGKGLVSVLLSDRETLGVENSNLQIQTAFVRNLQPCVMPTAGAASVQYLFITGDEWEGTANSAPLTGQGLRHLTRMPHLKKVQLADWSGGFPNLRHEDLEAVMRGLRGLLLLRICGGHCISARELTALHRLFPRIHLDLSMLGYRGSDLGWESGEELSLYVQSLWIH